MARVRKMMGLVVDLQYYLKVMRYSRQVSSCELALPTAPIPSRPDQQATICTPTSSLSALTCHHHKRKSMCLITG